MFLQYRERFVQDEPRYRVIYRQSRVFNPNVTWLCCSSLPCSDVLAT